MIRYYWLRSDQYQKNTCLFDHSDQVNANIVGKQFCFPIINLVRCFGIFIKTVLMMLMLSLSTTLAQESQLTVLLLNNLTEQPLPNISINAYKRLENSFPTVIATSLTNDQGEASFNLSGLGQGDIYVLSINPDVPGQLTEVSGIEITEPGYFIFRVNLVPITLLDGDQKQPLVSKEIRIYKKLADGQLERFQSWAGWTNENGTVYFDLPHLDSGSVYVAEAHRPFGSEGLKSYYTPLINQAGPIDFVLYRNGSHFVLNKRQLINRITFGATFDLLKHVNSVGALIFLGEQLHPETIDDTEFETMISGLEIGQDADLALWKVLHVSHSRRQLREVMTQFWDNHFSTDIQKTNEIFEQAENESFRELALDKFRALLEVSAKSPAMLQYLDNASSRKGAPNENYARELLELHTLGVTGGYSEQDVAEVARVFTGWTVKGGSFFFRTAWHDTGDKVVLGQNIQGRAGDSGLEEGLELLDMLATHPSTAHFICTKLIQLFIADQPSVGIENQCQMNFLNSEGDIRQVVESILISPEFNASNQFHSKIKTPLEFVAGVVRNLEAITPYTERNLNRALGNMGMSPFKNPVPTGWPETGESWMSSDQLMQRIQFVNQTVFQMMTSNVHVDLKTLFLTQGYETADEVVLFFLELALGNDYSTREREIALEVLNQGTPFDIHADNAEEQLRRLASTVLSFPTYQLQ